MSAPIPMVDLAAQHAQLAQPLQQAVQAVVTANAFIKGRFVQQFEEKEGMLEALRNAKPSVGQP